MLARQTPMIVPQLLGPGRRASNGRASASRSIQRPVLAHSPTTTLLDLQRTVGNQAVTGLLAGVAQRSPGSGQVIQR